MSDQDAFESAEQSAPTETPQEPSPTDAFADQLAAIQNEDGTPKYADVAQALGSIPHAQEHIQTIEGENATLKSELAKAQAARELLEKQAGTTKPTTDALTPEQVAEISQRTFQQQEQANREAANVNAVNAKFSELYGEKSSSEMSRIAADAGMSVAEVKDLAKRSPSAVFKLAGISQSPPPPPSRTQGVGAGDNFHATNSAPEPGKSVMSGATSKQMIESWKAAGEVVKANQG